MLSSKYFSSATFPGFWSPTMRRIGIVCFSLCLLFSTGCSISDNLFGVFGHYYSNGTTLDDRKAQYDQQVEVSGDRN
jgi:hypothetical protein